jgi:hypothetical protein
VPCLFNSNLLLLKFEPVASDRIEVLDDKHILTPTKIAARGSGCVLPCANLFGRDDHSNDLIVHLLDKVSRLLDCDSTQHLKTQPYRCQVRNCIVEQLHLNYGLSLAGFPEIEAASAAFDIRHDSSSINAVSQAA